MRVVMGAVMVVQLLHLRRSAALKERTGRACRFRSFGHVPMGRQTGCMRRWASTTLLLVAGTTSLVVVTAAVVSASTVRTRHTSGQETTAYTVGDSGAVRLAAASMVMPAVAEAGTGVSEAGLDCCHRTWYVVKSRWIGLQASNSLR